MSQISLGRDQVVIHDVAAETLLEKKRPAFALPRRHRPSRAVADKSPVQASYSPSFLVHVWRHLSVTGHRMAGFASGARLFACLSQLPLYTCSFGLSLAFEIWSINEFWSRGRQTSRGGGKCRWQLHCSFVSLSFFLSFFLSFSLPSSFFFFFFPYVLAVCAAPSMAAFKGWSEGSSLSDWQDRLSDIYSHVISLYLPFSFPPPVLSGL